MEIKFFVFSFLLLSCKPFQSNFIISSEMKEIVFSCDTNHNMYGNYPLQDTFVDTMIEFQITRKCKNEVSFFHEKTFVVPYPQSYTSHAPNEDFTIIRFFDENKNEIIGRFTGVTIDSAFVDTSYFIPTIIDTTTYLINNSSLLTIKQQLVLPYFKDSFFITLNKNQCHQTHFIKLCISKGKKKKGKLYGISCSEFIKVIRSKSF